MQSATSIVNPAATYSMHNVGDSNSDREPSRWWRVVTAGVVLLIAATLPSAAMADGFAPEQRYVRYGLIFETYFNGRFGYGIDYPVGIFVPQAPAQNGDGRRFVSVDGEASLTVWGSLFATPAAFADDAVLGVEAWFEEELGRSASATYTVLNEELGWFVISGVDNGDIYYRRSIAAPNRCGYLTFELRYPESMAAAFDPVVSVASSTFHCEIETAN